MTATEIEHYDPCYRVFGQVPYKCVTSAFESAGFRSYDDEKDEDKWNVLWGMGSRKTMKGMNKY